jgi:Concanavalin A-like lectin/glucanases superfamily
MARSFNGSSDQIVVSGVPSLTAGHAQCMSCWLMWPTTPSSYKGIVQLYGTGHYLLYTNGNKLAIYLTGISIDPTTTALVANTWYHIGVTCDGTTTLNIYLNGSLDSTTTVGAGSFGITGPANSNSAIGNDIVNAGRFLNGTIADVAFWDGVYLTATEILALSKGARPYTIRPQNLRAWWPLDGLQSPEPDLSGNASNGTLTGTSSAFGPPLMRMSLRTPQIFVPAVVTAVTLGGGTSIRPSVRQGWRW